MLLIRKQMGSFLKPTFNRWNLLWITWLDETYWVIGATLGGLIGPFLIFNLKKKEKYDSSPTNHHGFSRRSRHHAYPFHPFHRLPAGETYT